jgi:hypothetical protein
MASGRNAYRGFSQHDEFVGFSIRQFCANAQAQFDVYTDFDTRRQLLVDHVERVIYNNSKGHDRRPVASVSAATSKLQFRIDGVIDRTKSGQPVSTEDRRSSVRV